MGKGAKAVGKYIAGEFNGKNEYKRQKRQAKLNRKYGSNSSSGHGKTNVLLMPCDS
jgi:hypothetical protein